MYSEYALLKKNLSFNKNTYIIDDVDKAIIDETNMLLEYLEKDMVALSEITLIINENIMIDKEKLDKIEENVIEIDNTISETIPILEKVIEIKEQIDDKYKIIKIVGGAIIGGGLCGGIGFVFGIIPGIVGLGLGTSSGVGAIFAADKIKEKFKDKIFDIGL